MMLPMSVKAFTSSTVIPCSVISSLLFLLMRRGFLFFYRWWGLFAKTCMPSCLSCLVSVDSWQTVGQCHMGSPDRQLPSLTWINCPHYCAHVVHCWPFLRVCQPWARRSVGTFLETNVYSDFFIGLHPQRWNICGCVAGLTTFCENHSF